MRGLRRRVTTTGYGDLQGDQPPPDGEDDGIRNHAPARPAPRPSWSGRSQRAGGLRAAWAHPAQPGAVQGAAASHRVAAGRRPGRPRTQRMGNRPNLRQLIPAALQTGQPGGVQFTGAVPASVLERGSRSDGLPIGTSCGPSCRQLRGRVLHRSRGSFEWSEPTTLSSRTDLRHEPWNRGGRDRGSVRIGRMVKGPWVRITITVEEGGQIRMSSLETEREGRTRPGSHRMNHWTGDRLAWLTTLGVSPRKVPWAPDHPRMRGQHRLRSERQDDAGVPRTCPSRSARWRRHGFDVGRLHSVERSEWDASRSASAESGSSTENHEASERRSNRDRAAQSVRRNCLFDGPPIPGPGRSELHHDAQRALHPVRSRRHRYPSLH